MAFDPARDPQRRPDSDQDESGTGTSSFKTFDATGHVIANSQ